MFKRILNFSILISIFGLIYCFKNLIFAQESTNGSYIKFDPIVEYLTLYPNLFTTGTVTVTNPGNKLKNYQVQIRSFENNEEQPGVPRPLSIENTLEDPKSAATWFEFPVEEFELDSEETKEFEYKINVPADIAPGGYYAGIFFVDSEISDEGTVGGVLAGGPIYLIKIPGEIDENINLLEFKTDKSSYDYNPVKFITRVENTGNIHVVPRGEIKLTNMFGQEIAVIPFNPEKYNVLRESITSFETEWNQGDNIFRKLIFSDGKLLFGKINAEIILIYKSEDPGLDYIEKEISFWVIPWKAILTFFIFIIVVIIILFRKKIFNRNS